MESEDKGKVRGGNRGSDGAADRPGIPYFIGAISKFILWTPAENINDFSKLR